MAVTPTKVIVATPIYHHPTAEFLWCLLHLEGRDSFVMVKGVMLDQARRLLVQRALEDVNATHILMADSDLAFPPGALRSLLVHDVPVVAGVYPARQLPYAPLVYENSGSLFKLVEVPKEPTPVAAMPCGFMLVKREVFAAIDSRFGRARWFEIMPGIEPDLSFCKRVIACGIKILCDPRVYIRHTVEVLLDISTAMQLAAGERERTQ